MNKIDCLDKGYVRLVDKMGSDLTPVNAARVSYDKSTQEMRDADRRLLHFLGREGHTSPFRHAMLQFEVYAPLVVARQWWKYVVGSSHQDNMAAWNESSRRYVTEEPVFYIPDEWRSAPENSKQGSGSSISKGKAQTATELLEAHIQNSEWLYKTALETGICAEQARLFLPAYGMYVRWYWTASLQGVGNFLDQRLGHDAQKEIQEYAKAVEALTGEAFPEALEAILK